MGWNWTSVKGPCSECLQSESLRRRLDVLANWPVAPLVYQCPHGAMREAGSRPRPDQSVETQFAHQISETLQGARGSPVRRNPREKGGCVVRSELTRQASAHRYDPRNKTLKDSEGRLQTKGIYRVADASASADGCDLEADQIYSNFIPNSRRMRTLFLRLQRLARSEKVRKNR